MRCEEDCKGWEWAILVYLCTSMLTCTCALGHSEPEVQVDSTLEEKLSKEQTEFIADTGLDQVDQKEQQMRKKLPPGVFGIEQKVCCNATWECTGSAATGVMFDVEAGSTDLVITGIDCCTDTDKGPVEYVVFARYLEHLFTQ